MTHTPEDHPASLGKIVRRWLAGLLPKMLLGALLLAPLVIWLVKREEPPIQRIEMNGRVVAETPPSPTGGSNRRIAVRLDDGTTVAIDAAARPGDQVTIVRTTLSDGTVSYALRTE